MVVLSRRAHVGLAHGLARADGVGAGGDARVVVLDGLARLGQFPDTDAIVACIVQRSAVAVVTIQNRGARDNSDAPILWKNRRSIEPPAS